MNYQNISVDTFLMFITVTDCGSISKAANLLYLVQSSISRRIHQLEVESGLSLFERSSKGVTPTKDGISFYEFAKYLITKLNDFSEKNQNNTP